MKKSGVNTTEHQHAPEQTYRADKHFSGGDDQYTAADDQYPPGADQYTARENQYTPEDTEYSEEYQYTWAWTGTDCTGLSQDLEWHATNYNNQPL